MFPRREIFQVAMQAIATVACEHRTLQASPTTQTPATATAATAETTPMLPSSPPPTPPLPAPHGPCFSSAPLPPQVWALTGSCALNLYIPLEYTLEPSDVDFLVVVDTSALPPQSVRAAMIATAERAVRRVNEIMTRALLSSHAAGPWVTFRNHNHCNTSAFTCNLFCLNAKVGDLTFIELAQDLKVSAAYPRMCVPVVVGTTSMMMCVCSSDELLYRIRCTVYNTGTADGLTPGEDNQWRIVKDYKRLALFDTFGGLAQKPREFWAVGRDSRVLDVDVARFFPNDSPTPMWGTRRRMLALNMHTGVVSLGVAPGPVPVMLVPMMHAVPVVPVATTQLLLSRMSYMATAAMDAFGAAVCSRLQAHTQKLQRCTETAKAATRTYATLQTQLSNRVRNRVKRTKQEMVQMQAIELRRMDAMYRKHLTAFASVATDNVARTCSTLSSQVTQRLSKVERGLASVRTRLQVLHANKDASCAMHAQLQDKICGLVRGIQLAHQQKLDLWHEASQTIVSLCKCLKSVHVHLYDLTGRRVEQYGMHLVAKARRGADEGIFPFCLFSDVFGLPLNTPTTDVARDPDAKDKHDEDVASSIQDGLLTILVGTVMSAMHVIHSSRSPEVADTTFPQSSNAKVLARRDSWSTPVEMLDKISKALKSLGRPTPTKYWLPMFKQNGIYAVQQNTLRRGVSQPDEGDLEGVHESYLELNGGFCYSGQRLFQKFKLMERMNKGKGMDEGTPPAAAAGAVAGAGLGTGVPTNTMPSDSDDMYLHLPMEPHVAEGVVAMMESVSAFLFQSFSDVVLQKDARFMRAMEVAMGQGLSSSKRMEAFLSPPSELQTVYPQAIMLCRLIASNTGLSQEKILNATKDVISRRTFIAIPKEAPPAKPTSVPANLPVPTTTDLPAPVVSKSKLKKKNKNKKSSK